MKFSAVSLLVLALCLTGCATNRLANISPIPQPGQRIEYVEGLETAVSQGKKASFFVGPSNNGYYPGTKFLLKVWIFNETQQPITVIPSEFVARVSGEPARVRQLPDLLAEIAAEEQNAQLINALNAMSQGIASASAGTGTYSGTTTGTIYGTDGSMATVQMRESGTYYDPRVAQEAQRQVSARQAFNSAQISEKARQRWQNYEQWMLRPTTIGVGENIFGWVVIEARRNLSGERNVEVDFVIEGELHKYVLREYVIGQ